MDTGSQPRHKRALSPASPERPRKARKTGSSSVPLAEATSSSSAGPTSAAPEKTPVRKKAPAVKGVSAQTVKPTRARKNDSGSSGSVVKGGKGKVGSSIGLDLTRKPMYKIKDIFEDLTKQAMALGFQTVLEWLKHQHLKIATMCSGTESPILALQMIKDSLRTSGRSLEFTHLFSAEIDAFKQAYIERNFHTSIIFRDVREIATQDKASTAYGADQAVPQQGEVDVLVAGFACVDFSNLNSRRKGLDGTLTAPKADEKKTKSKAKKPERKPITMPTQAEIASHLTKLQDAQRGESGDTLYAILAYAAKCRPPIVLLENIISAPWEKIVEEWNRIGYAAEYCRMDTKLYYLPHTRQRIYMLCLDMGAYKDAEAAVSEWEQLVVKFQRPASSPVDAFILDDADPRLAEATMDLTRTGSRGRATKEIAWLRSEIRHLLVREKENLGDARPITLWMANGSSEMLDYANLPWTQGQVLRIKDIIDLTWLRAGIHGYDPAYKPRYPDLSQDIDRHYQKGAWGITGCLTPSGIPYSTLRGGPIVGYESLSLQGIPVHKLLLTRETQRQLQDLAGNAMTSTVVAAALLSALIVAHPAIPRSAARERTLVVKEKTPRITSRDMLTPESSVLFGGLDSPTLRLFYSHANSSAQYCACEGQNFITPSTLNIYKCKGCGFLACEKCAGMPRHKYRHLKTSQKSIRALPNAFREEITDILPMRLKFTGEVEKFIFGLRKRFDAAGEQIKEEGHAFSKAVLLALVDEHRFQTSKRFKFWTICYEGRHSRLEFVLTESKAQWLLYAKADDNLTGDSKLRKMLQMPVAKMTVKSNRFFEGEWQFRVPATKSFNLNIEGCGTLVPSFKARLGLADFLQEKVWSSWNMSVVGNRHPELDVNGVYTLLPDCGTATNNLHRRESAGSDTVNFLFLDSQRCTEPDHDHFVIASDHRRLRYGEHRMVEASIAKGHGKDKTNWRPNGQQGVQTTRCTTEGVWVQAGVNLAPMTDGVATFSTLGNVTTVSDVAAPECQNANMVALSCEFDLSDGQVPEWPSDDWRQVDPANELATYAELAWITERVRHLQHFDGRWREVGDLVHHAACNVCSPAKPSIKWKLAETKIFAIVPFENVAEAGPYERAIKNRPPPICTFVRQSNGKGLFEVAINVVTLVHRATALLRQHTLNSEYRVRLGWKLDTQYNPARLPNLPKIIIPDNKEDKPMEHVFEESSGTPKRALRLEQQRSLRWMVSQESEAVEPFLEEEVEESLLGPLGWRLQARAASSRLVRGGVLADKVGYGKTVTVLALIERQKAGINMTPVEGYIRLKATLIMAPSLLIIQWTKEIKDFLGKACKVLIIDSITALVKATISDFQSADIILVSHEICTHKIYLRRVAWFAARPEGPPGLQTRAFTIWLREAEEKMKDHVEELKTSQSLRSFGQRLARGLRDAENDGDLLERIPSKRLKGQAYMKSKAQGSSKAPAAMANEDQGEDEAAGKAEASAQARAEDPFGLLKAKAPGSMMGPILQMFVYERVIIDEYTYLEEMESIPLITLRSDKRWALSGTPKIGGHAEVKQLGAFVGVDLGTDENGRGVMKGHNMALNHKEKTNAEMFSSFTQAQSSDWHEHRHGLAQAFVKQFVRQNEAEIGEIPSESIYKATTQHSAERAVYLELQTQLYGQDMQLVKGRGSNVDSDHLNRLHEMITTSASPEEALLKRCSVFQIESPGGKAEELEVLEMMIDTRQAEFEDHRLHLVDRLNEAVAMKQHCGEADTHYQRWFGLVCENTYGDKAATENLRSMVYDAEKFLGPREAGEASQQDVQKLRELKITLHKMALEYVTRMRMLRFLQQFYGIQEWSRKTGRKLFKVDCCGSKFENLDDLSVLALCGHTACKNCLYSDSHESMCPVNGCTGPALAFHAIDARELLNRPTAVPGPKHFGSKIEDLVKLVQEIKAADETAQILLFVQYVDVMKVIGKAFEAANVSFAAITGGSLKHGAENKIMQEFKGEGPTNVTPKTVLMLDASSSCAAGHNITSANHVIFVSPFLASNNHDFDQLYEQAVGRARRYGQMKTVFVYHIVCLGTIDVNTIEQATGKRIVPVAGGGIDLVDADASNAGQGLGTVKFSARRAVVVEEAESEIGEGGDAGEEGEDAGEEGGDAGEEEAESESGEGGGCWRGGDGIGERGGGGC
ncbi:hypothetical protein MMC30_009062 [Trapelia coarctata]|nr:hypothetical protein [Trapelia coarctata]